MEIPLLGGGRQRSSEREWWDSFYEIANRQWLLTDALNSIVRREYLQEMAQFLFLEGGSVLDVGCGPGWVGLILAQRGMSLIGIDLARAQIDTARQQAANLGVRDATFIHGPIADLDVKGFDSMILHATLHHLPEGDIGPLLIKLHQLLKEGGKLYLYEPLAPKRDVSVLQAVAIAFFLLLYGPWYVLHWLAIRLTIGPSAFRQAVRKGWTGFSPKERPLDKKWLVARLQDAGFRIVQEPMYWHAYSLSFAMGCTELSPPLSWIARLNARLLYVIDRAILSSPLKEYVCGVWTFASILVEKTMPQPQSGKVACV